MSMMAIILLVATAVNKIVIFFVYEKEFEQSKSSIVLMLECNNGRSF